MKEEIATDTVSESYSEFRMTEEQFAQDRSLAKTNEQTKWIQNMTDSNLRN